MLTLLLSIGRLYSTWEKVLRIERLREMHRAESLAAPREGAPATRPSLTAKKISETVACRLICNSLPRRIFNQDCLGTEAPLLKIPDHEAASRTTSLLTSDTDFADPHTTDRTSSHPHAAEPGFVPLGDPNATPAAVTTTTSSSLAAPARLGHW